MDVSPTMNKKLGGEGHKTRFDVALESVKMLVEQKVIHLKVLD